MITRLGSVTILVPDQEEALRFYTEILGFEKGQDDSKTMPGFRWLTVAPHGDDVEIVLAKPGPPMTYSPQNIPEDRPLSVRCIVPSKKIESGRAPGMKKETRVQLEFGLVDEVNVAIAMNEKMAEICFPDLNGRIDFSYSFRGSSAGFHKWCQDVFISSWEKAKKRSVTQLQSLGKLGESLFSK